MDYKRGDRVNLPFGETGTVIKVKERLWASLVYVRIRKAVFNKTNEVIDFLEKQVSHE